MTSRLDYCNAMFANCSVDVRQQLQRIQNSATRVIHLRCSHEPHRSFRFALAVNRATCYQQVVCADVRHCPGLCTFIPSRVVLTLVVMTTCTQRRVATWLCLGLIQN